MKFPQLFASGERMKVWHTLLLSVLSATVCIGLTGTNALGSQGENVTGDQIPDWIKPSDYEYSPFGKPDPFRSFIKTGPGEGAAVQRKKPTRPLTPLEQVEVTQLELVGILWYPEQPEKVMAMVKLPDGKGFVLRQGTRVGPHDGEVVEITPDEVRVREEFVTIFGKEETRIVPLKLYHGSGE